MSESKHHHHQTGPEPANPQADKIPYWQRAHRDWRFWVGVICMIAAITVYVLSLDLSIVPHNHGTGFPAAN